MSPERKNPETRASRFVARARNFLSAYSWLAKSHLRRHLLLVIGVAVLGFLSAAAQGTVIAFVAKALDVVQNPREIGIEGVDRLLATPAIALTLFGICLTVIAGIGTIARYNAARCCRRLGRLFHERIIADSLALLSGTPALPASLGFEDEAQFQRAVTRNGAVLGRTTESFVRMIEPMLRLLVGVGILAAIDARLCVILVPLGGLLLPALYVSGMRLRRGAESFYEESTVGFGRSVREIVQYLNSRNTDDGQGEQDRILAMVRDAEGTRDYLNEFDAMTLASERVQFIVNSVSATVLGFSLIASGWLAAEGHIAWGEAMASLLALWQIQSAAQQCGANLSMLNRFYPFIAQSRRVLSETLSDPALPIDGDAVCITMPSADPKRLEPFHLRAGDRACLIGDVGLDRIGFDAVLSPLATASGRPLDWWHANARFINSRFRVLHRTVPEIFASAPGIDAETLSHDLGIDDELAHAGGGHDAIVTPEHWASLTGSARALLTLIAAVSDPHPILICDGRLVHGLHPDAFSRLTGLFSDRILLLYFSEPTDRVRLAPVFAVCRKGRFLGAGSSEWYTDIMPTLGRAKLSVTPIEDDDDGMF